MKIFVLTASTLLATTCLFAGESTLTQTVQPLDGLGSGEIVITSVACHDWYAHSGHPTAIGLITARNIPPTNAPKPVEDINVASACGIALSFHEDAAGRGVVTLDCQDMAIPARLGCTALEVVGATLECLRQVMGSKLDAMTIKAALKPAGQEDIQKLVDAFIKQPKDKPFRWK